MSWQALAGPGLCSGGHCSLGEHIGEPGRADSGDLLPARFAHEPMGVVRPFDIAGANAIAGCEPAWTRHRYDAIAGAGDDQHGAVDALDLDLGRAPSIEHWQGDLEQHAPGITGHGRDLPVALLRRQAMKQAIDRLFRAETLGTLPKSTARDEFAKDADGRGPKCADAGRDGWRQ